MRLGPGVRSTWLDQADPAWRAARVRCQCVDLRKARAGEQSFRSGFAAVSCTRT